MNRHVAETEVSELCLQEFAQDAVPRGQEVHEPVHPGASQPERPIAAGQMPRLRFGLRSLLAAVMLACCGMAVYRTFVRQYYVERGIVDSLVADGASVCVGVHPAVSVPGMQSSDWTIFDTVGELRVFDMSHRQTDLLSRLSECRNLHTLTIMTRAPSIDLRGIQHLPSVRRLVLHVEGLNASHLQMISAAQQLEEIEIICGDMSPSAFERLSRLKRLRHLVLVGAQIDREGLASFRRKRPDVFVDELYDMALADYPEEWGPLVFAYREASSEPSGS